VVPTHSSAQQACLILEPTPLIVGFQKTAWRLKGTLTLTLTSASGVPTFLPIEDTLLVEANEGLFDCLLGAAVLTGFIDCLFLGIPVLSLVEGRAGLP
jgi:hypothetical protein